MCASQSPAGLLDLIAAAFDRTAESVVVIDRTYHLRYANDAACRVQQLPRGELVGASCFVALKDRVGPCGTCPAGEVFTTGQDRELEKSEIRRDGTERWVVHRWFGAGHDENGRPILVVHITHDVTALRAARNHAQSLQAAADSLTRERNRAQSYLENASALIVLLDPEGRVALINRLAAATLGVDAKAAIGMDWFSEFVPADEAEEARRQYANVIASSNCPDKPLDLHQIRCDGALRVIRWYCSIMRSPDGSIEGVLRSGIDVTDELRLARDLSYRSHVLDESVDAVIVHDLSGNPLYANAAARELSGRELPEFLALSPFGWVSPVSRDRMPGFVETLRLQGRTIFETELIGPDSAHIPVETHATMLRIEDEEVVVTASRDITERRAAAETIFRMAYYDDLTGLANRSMFSQALSDALETPACTGDWLALAFLDIDHFKVINDTLGHRHGDELLVRVAERLQAAVRSADTVGRIGGDEFTVLFQPSATKPVADALAEKLLGCFAEPFVIGKETIVATASVGIALSRVGETDCDTMLAHADTAMYSAKYAGRNQHRVYVGAMGEATRRRFELKNSLALAISQGQMVVEYQPQMSVDGERITGVEALVRWHHPEHGVIAPLAFLPAVEESGQVIALGEYVLEEASRHAAAWQREFDPALVVAVNLSPRQFEDPGLIGVIQALLERYALAPSTLELEITEGVAMRDAVRMCTTFERLKLLGVRLAIDDFGTGFSSLDRLMNLDVDTLKLDRAFVADLESDERARAISDTVIYLGRRLGLRVVAEGVETSSQLQILADSGCSEVQGFLLGQPMPADEITELLRAMHERR